MYLYGPCYKAYQHILPRIPQWLACNNTKPDPPDLDTLEAQTFCFPFRRVALGPPLPDYPRNVLAVDQNRLNPHPGLSPFPHHTVRRIFASQCLMLTFLPIASKTASTCTHGSISLIVKQEIVCIYRSCREENEGLSPRVMENLTSSGSWQATVDCGHAQATGELTRTVL